MKTKVTKTLSPTAKKLRSFRLSRDFTLQQMSNLLGYSANTIAQWETGKTISNTAVLELALEQLEKEYYLEKNKK